MKAWHWLIVVVALVALLAGVAVIPFFAGRFGLLGGYRGMMGLGRAGMMAYGPLAWVGILMILFRLGTLVLIVLGVVWLVSTLSRPATLAPIVATRPCPNCGRPVQADWRNCPYCGTALGQSTGPQASS